MQVIKPATLSLLHNTYYLKGHQFVVSALSFFKLNSDAELLAENSQWLRLQPYLNQGVIIDTGHAKGQAEMLLAGAAYAAKGNAVRSMSVSAQVASIDKAVHIVGDRVYSRSNALTSFKTSDPEPFIKMPLDFVQSFGGNGFTDNTVGKGVIDKNNYDAEQKVYHLANLYFQDESIKPDKKNRKVASFLPRDITHPLRTKYQGTYDQTWLDEVHPGFPDDTNLRLFNVAPIEQQQAKPFEPNASYSLSGLHPDYAQIEGCLPDVLVRAFVTQEIDGDKQFKEISTHIDTVWFFPELELGIAVHRGVLPVEDSAGLDVKNLLLAIEGAKDKPRETAYYQKVLTDRLDPKKGAGHAFHASQLLPQLSEEETARRAKLYAVANVAQQEKVTQQRFKQLKKLQQQHPELNWDKIFEQESEHKQDSDVPGPIPQEMIDKGDFDLSPYIEWSRQQAQDAKAKMASIRKNLEQQQAQKPKAEPEVESSDSILARTMAVVLVQAQAEDLSELDLGDASAEEKQAHMHRLMLKSQRRSRQLSPVVTQSKAVSEQGSQLLRQQVLTLMSKGESLVGRDLAGADLSGLDLSGQDLRDVMLERANLTNANFNGCQCDGLVLTEAQLDGACFNHCRLVKANLSTIKCYQTKFKQAVFDHVVVMESHFEACHFTKANFIKMNLVTSHFDQSIFSESTWDGVQLIQCELENTRWQKANLTQCTFLQCQFAHSQWLAARLLRCALLKSDMAAVDFTSVSAQRVQITVEGTFSKSVFNKSNWEYCGFRDLSFVACDLSNGVFKNCDFSMAIFNQSHFKKALWQGCLFFQSRFTKGDGSDVLFYQSNLRKAVFAECDLSDATFHETNRRETQFDDCNMTRVKRYPLASLAAS